MANALTSDLGCGPFTGGGKAVWAAFELRPTGPYDTCRPTCLYAPRAGGHADTPRPGRGGHLALCTSNVNNPRS